ISDRHAVQEYFKLFSQAHKQLDALINCAALIKSAKIYAETSQKPLPLQEIEEVMQTNLIGTFDVIRNAVPLMIESKHKKKVIINTTSTSAFDGVTSQSVYSASKAGLVSMTLPLARELAQYGIRVNSIAPGLFHSKHLLKSVMRQKEVEEYLCNINQVVNRLGKPSEFVHLVETVIDNQMLNGVNIRLDAGGRLIFS
ncbi:hypothetical protein Ciccas_003649, partial [Cichlidogyrus casuarinus]